MVRDPSIDGAFRRELCDWFNANGVDPAQIPGDPNASIADGQLTYRQFVLSPLTRTRQIDPADPIQFLTEVCTVPVVVEPPPGIAEWLRPKCPACGR